MLPIYQSGQTYQTAKTIFNDNSHSGLWFDRFYDYQIFDNQGNPIIDERTKKDAKIQEKENFFKSFNGSKGVRQCGNKDDLQSYAERLANLCHAQQGKTAIYQNDWLMAIGLGNSHPLENGLLWHPTLGVPYFQGSTVKGLAKALMEQWGADPKLIKRWFGSVNATSSKTADFTAMFGMSLTEELKKQLDEQSIGDFIFLDAVPVAPVMLKQSIMTPHYGDWYQNGDSNPTNKSTQPGDWHSPVPVSFLAVENAKMQFGVMPRLGATVSSDEIEQINNIIQMALLHLGVGAKTATGYGRMRIDEKAIQKSADRQKHQAKAEQAKLEKANLSENQQLIYDFKIQLDKKPTNEWHNKPNATLNIVLNGENLWFATLFSKVETWADNEQKFALEQIFMPNKKHLSKNLQRKVTALVEKFK